jgi:hypothetical protein
MLGLLYVGMKRGLEVTGASAHEQQQFDSNEGGCAKTDIFIHTIIMSNYVTQTCRLREFQLLLCVTTSPLVLVDPCRCFSRAFKCPRATLCAHLLVPPRPRLYVLLNSYQYPSISALFFDDSLCVLVCQTEMMFGRNAIKTSSKSAHSIFRSAAVRIQSFFRRGSNF